MDNIQFLSRLHQLCCLICSALSPHFPFGLQWNLSQTCLCLLDRWRSKAKEKFIKYLDMLRMLPILSGFWAAWVKKSEHGTQEKQPTLVLVNSRICISPSMITFSIWEKVTFFFFFSVVPVMSRELNSSKRTSGRKECKCRPSGEQTVQGTEHAQKQYQW